MPTTEVVFRGADFPFIGKHVVAFQVSTGRLFFVKPETDTSENFYTWLFFIPPDAEELAKTLSLNSKQCAAIASFIKNQEEKFLSSQSNNVYAYRHNYYDYDLGLDITVYSGEHPELHFTVPDIANGLKTTLAMIVLLSNIKGRNTLPFQKIM